MTVSKILVEVAVPAADARLDVLIPYESRFAEVLELVKAAFTDEVASTFEPSDDTILCDAGTGAIFNLNLTSEELGLVNGSRLILM